MKTGPSEAVLLQHEKLGASAAPGRTHVTSFGGVGTSALMIALAAAGAAINSGGDCDGMKHLPFGRLMHEKASHMLKNPPVARILYVYDDPTDAVMSLFRRGYNWDQLDKVGAPASYSPPRPTGPHRHAHPPTHPTTRPPSPTHHQPDAE
mgnify:CR=1 FL=1